MIKKKICEDLISKFDILDLEKHFIWQFIEFEGLDYSKNDIVMSYLSGFDLNAELAESVKKLEIESLDILVSYLEILIPPQERRKNGAFFTPRYIIDFIIRHISPQEFARNLDPSCGCGAFLIGLARYYKTKFGKPVARTIKENIFGADILSYNIRRARILLALLATQSGENLSLEDINLAIQNSLKAEWTKVFPQVTSGIFTNIVGNPPYVKFQDLDEEDRKFLLSKWVTTADGSFNLYFAFFELGHNLLSDSGMVGYITPNNYFTSLSAKPLREFFQKERCLSTIIDFSHQKIFDTQTYTAISFLTKRDNPVIYYAKIEDTQKPEDFLELYAASPNLLDDLKSSKWRLLRGTDRENVKKIESHGTPLGKIVDICVGIATLKDDLYFIDGKSQQNGFYTTSFDNKTFLIEPEITKKIFKISDFVTQEECDANTRRIIFPYETTGTKATPIPEDRLRSEFPNCYAYFLAIKELLGKRDKGKKVFEPFYVYGRTQGLAKSGLKLLTPTFSRAPRFFFANDPKALFCNGYGLFFKEKQKTVSHALSTEKRSLVLQKVLNSALMDYYVSSTSVSIQGGFPCYQKNFIERFCIPDFTKEEQKQILELSPKDLDTFLFSHYNLLVNPSLLSR
jgi:hypothetical protein